LRKEEKYGFESCAGRKTVTAVKRTICEAAATVINPAAKVKCLVCPPDEHPEDVWCEWEFEIPE
jgi:hypothetical protein